MKEFASNNLRQLRREKDLSQEYMALELGISQKAYSKIENGKSELSHNRLLSIAKILDISPKELCPIYPECTQNTSKFQRLLKYLEEKGIKIPDFDI